MNYTESERKPNPNYVPPAGYVEVTKEYLNRQYKIDPLYKLFEYSCDRFYTIEYGDSCYSRTIKGFLLNCGGPRYYFLTEHGLCIIKSKEINTMFPIPMPKDLSNNFKKLIETYLKEREEFLEEEACKN